MGLVKTLIIDERQRMIQQPPAETLATARWGDDEPAKMRKPVPQILAVDRQAAEKPAALISMPKPIDRPIQAADEIGKTNSNLPLERQPEAHKVAIGFSMQRNHPTKQARAIVSMDGNHRAQIP